MKWKLRRFLSEEIDGRRFCQGWNAISSLDQISKYWPFSVSPHHHKIPPSLLVSCGENRDCEESQSEVEEENNNGGSDWPTMLTHWRLVTRFGFSLHSISRKMILRSAAILFLSFSWRLDSEASDEAEADCIDRSPYCNYNDCAVRPGYAMDYCKKTCGDCKG
jgi:hypothetical protein